MLSVLSPHVPQTQRRTGNLWAVRLCHGPQILRGRDIQTQAFGGLLATARAGSGLRTRSASRVQIDQAAGEEARVTEPDERQQLQHLLDQHG